VNAPPTPAGPARVRAAAGLAVLLAALAVLAGPPGAPGPSVAFAADEEVRTPHVVARGTVGREALEAYAALGEACYAQWKAYFRAEPKPAMRPLVMDVRRTRDEWVAALSAAGVSGAQSMRGAGGYYDHGTKVSYLYLQPHDSSTRLLVLHELTHQFQYKAVLGSETGRSPLWHREGLAEHFGYHRRTEQGLLTGVYDMVAIDARPAEIADRVTAGTFDPWAIGTGRVASPDYADALGLVGLLLRTEDAGLRRAFARFEEDLERGGDAGEKFRRAFAGLEKRLAAAATEVWGRLRRPWKVVYIAWDEEPGAIVGRGLPWAFLQGTERLEGGAAWAEATIGLGRETVAGGVAIGVRDADNLVSAEVRGDRRVLVRVKRSGTWWDLGQVPLAVSPADRPVRVRLEARGADLVVHVDGVPALELPASATRLGLGEVTGAAGLIAESGPARFREARTSAGG
jgi:hypothetical protein